MDDQAEWLPFHAVAITTHPIPAYGGFQAPVGLLERIADEFNAGSVPMHAHHDLTDPIRTRSIGAAVRARDDGYHELVLTGEVHADDWSRVGHLSGMSVTLNVPIGDDVGGSSASGDSVTIAADAGWFADSAIIEAAERIGGDIETQPARAYQFGLVPDPQVYVELTMATLQALGPNLAASALWDGLKHLLRRRRVPDNADGSSRTVINFSLTDRAGWTAALDVDTEDPETARYAIDKLADAATSAIAAQSSADSAAPIRWDAEEGVWRAVGAAGDSPLAPPTTESGEEKSD